VTEKMVDLVGIEPTTSSMPWKRAPSCATGPLAREKFPGVRNRLGMREGTTIIFAYRNPIVNAGNILLISFHGGFCHN
jgi:hypothetical protein